jgi:hypothetical protein
MVIKNKYIHSSFVRFAAVILDRKELGQNSVPTHVVCRNGEKEKRKNQSPDPPARIWPGKAVLGQMIEL